MSKIILITAAGSGSRYRRAGLVTPKPLIVVKRKTLLEHTLESFSIDSNDILIIAVQQEHLVKEKLEAKLSSNIQCQRIYWVELNMILSGQLATANYAIKKYKNSSDSSSLNWNLWIHNCDTGFYWPNQSQIIESYSSMPVFEADGEHWSFGKQDPKDKTRAIEIAEKKRISNLASIGLYGFNSCSKFLKESTYQLQYGELLNNEHYIAPMLQRFIQEGKIVNMPIISNVKQFGTPRETCKTFDISLQELKRMNQ